MARGNVVLVEEAVAGSELAADVLAAATSITVVDPTDFSPDGGTVFIAGATPETIAYLTSDDATGIVTLAAALAAGHLTGDLVTIQPTSVERFAHVQIAEQEESLEARVPHALYDRLAVGLRDDSTGETELVELGTDDAGLLVVTDVVDREPTVDGSFIDSTTLPPAGTDGSPPAISPTPILQAGIGSLFVNWTAIANADPVTYEVHISTTTGFTPGPSTLSGKTGATQIGIRTMPDLSPLDYATTYYVKLIATDADGAAAASAQAGGSPQQITSADIAAASIVGDRILGNTITADLLNAVIEVAGTIETADAGQRSVMDSAGFHQYAPDGSTLVDFPNDPTKPSTFSGEIDAGAVSVTGLAQLAGETQILPNAELHLIGGQPDPNLAPGLSAGYGIKLNFDYNVDAHTVTGTRITHYSATGGAGGTTPCYYGTVDTLASGGGTHRTYVVEWLASNGHINRSLQLDNGVTTGPVGFGACLIGSEIVAVYISNTSLFQFQNIARATFTLDSTVTPGTQPGSAHFDPTSAHVIGFGCDGANPYIFSWSSATKLPNRGKCTMSAGQATGAIVFTDFSTSAVHLFDPGHANNLGDTGGATNVLGGAWDGTNWYVLFSWANSGGALVGRVLQQYVQSTSAIVAKQEIFLPFSVGFFGGGITYDGTDYYLAGGSSTTTLRKVSGSVALTWDFALGVTLYAGYVWQDGSGHHTGVSPVGSLNMDSGIAKAPLQRQQVIVTMPAIPALATQNLFYALFAGSPPAGSALKLQSAPSHASTNTSPTVTFLTWDATGATPTASTYVAGGTPARIIGDGSGVGGTSWKLDSSGAMIWTRRTTAQRPGSPSTGDVALNTDVGLPELWDGSGYQWGGNQRDQEDVYDAIEALAGITGFGGRVIGVTTDIDSALANPITYTTQRLSGGTFLVRRPATTAGMMVFTSTAAGGLVGGYNGAQLWQWNAGGDLVYLADTGADSRGRGLFNATGLNNLTWRNVADTADITVALVPGAVYFVTITAIISSGSLVLAGVNPSTIVNLGRSASPFRSGGRNTSITARQTATVLAASLQTFTSLPWIGVY